MHHTCFVPLVLALVLVACSDSGNPIGPQSSGQFLSGTVYDQAGKPIQHVGVHYLYETKSLSPLPKLNGTTVTITIRYNVPAPGHVTLRILRWYSRDPIDTLVDQQQNAGNYQVVLDASHMTNGLYLYQLTIDTFFVERLIPLLNTDINSLVQAGPLATTDAQGTFSVPYRMFGFGVTLHVSSPSNPTELDSVCISTIIQLVLFKQGYQTLVQPISIDTTRSVSMIFTLPG